MKLKVEDTMSFLVLVTSYLVFLDFSFWGSTLESKYLGFYVSKEHYNGNKIIRKISAWRSFHGHMAILNHPKFYMPFYFKRGRKKE